MIRAIVSDYFRMFRISMHERRKYFYKVIYMPTYIVFLAVLQASLGNIDWDHVIVEFALLMPLVFSYISVSIHPLWQSKMLYLCPLSPKERKQYICASYFFRIGLHMSAAAVGTCIAAVYSDCDFFSVTEILLNHLLVAVLVNREWTAQGKKNRMVIGEIIFISALISNAMQIIITVDTAPNMWLKVTLLLLLCFIQMPLAVRHLKSVRRELQAAVFFEEARM